ncbi:MAG: outer membrane beta-barrel protein [Longimicrobiales bacterium]
MRYIRAAALIGASLLLPATLQAQDRWGFDLRAGAAVPVSELSGGDFDTGFGFEGTLMVRTMEHVFVYGGWDWHRFTSEQSFAGSDVDFEETGYAFGLLFEHPLSVGGGTAIQVRAGATANHIEIEDGGDVVADSGHGLGWEAGAGLAVRIGGAWRATPGVRFRTTSRDIEFGATTTTVDLDYLAFEIGFSRLF